MRAPPPFDILVITDPAAPRGLAPYLEALDAGVERWAMIVRDHDGPDARVARVLEALVARAGPIPLLLAAASAARIELAARCGVGAHLAERAPPATVARGRLGAAWLGASVHDRAGLDRRSGEGVDFVTLAPLHAVPGKGAPLAAETVRELSRSSTPIFGLGGVRGATEVRAALAMGCVGVAVRANVASADDGGRTLRSLRVLVDEARAERDLARRTR